MLAFQSVSFSYPAAVSDKPLLSNLSFSVSPGQRVCVVGPNGIGKSTVLALATGELQPDSGRVVRPVGLSAPTSFEACASVGDVVEAYVAPLRALESEFSDVTVQVAQCPEDTALGARYDELLALMESAQVWELDARREETLAALGLGEVALEWPVEKLSPGQVGRLHVAGLLLSRPAVLVLDEPTNHLDDAAREFLVRTVRGWDGPVVYASHDRSFIERTATALVDLDTAPWQAISTAAGSAEVLGCFVCAGTYSDFRREKAAARQRHIELHAQQQELAKSISAHAKDSEVVGHRDFKVRSEAKVAKKFYADRTQRAVTRRISDDQRRLDQLKQVEVRRPRYEDQIPVLPSVSPSPSTILVSTTAVADRTIEGRRVKAVQNQEFELCAGEQLLLTGPNGCGKSTFLSWLAHSGACLAPSAYLPQQLPSGSLPSALELLRSHGCDQDVLQGFVHPRFWAQPIHTLSQGNQRRTQIALTFAGVGKLVEGHRDVKPVIPEVLLLDEPTNYLDLDFIEAFEEALRDYKGAVVLASHDQWLIDKWSGRIFRFDSGSTS